jgi:hypothetical protein
MAACFEKKVLSDCTSPRDIIAGVKGERLFRVVIKRNTVLPKV